VSLRKTFAPSNAGICPANPHSFFGFPNFDTLLRAQAPMLPRWKVQNVSWILDLGLALVGQLFFMDFTKWILKTDV
jgi:hypothetical protein